MEVFVVAAIVAEALFLSRGFWMQRRYKLSIKFGLYYFCIIAILLLYYV